MKLINPTTLLIAALTCSGAFAGRATDGARIPSSTSKGSAIKAAISGVEEGKVYGEIPPVLVELKRLPRNAEVWVEVYQGSGLERRRGATVESKLFVLSSGDALLNIPTLTRACRENGPWTVLVLSGSGLNTRTLAQTTFKVGSGGSELGPESNLVRQDLIPAPGL